MDGHQLTSDSLYQKGCHYRRVNTAGECEKYFLVTYLLSQRGHLFFNELFCSLGSRDTLHVGRTDIS